MIKQFAFQTALKIAEAYDSAVDFVYEGLSDKEKAENAELFVKCKRQATDFMAFLVSKKIG